ncbi:Hypothetical protein A7982_08377 [Minicystis rosea]|nr:Hypothetical protein A7982_08377 [Minicystis rosea]
MRAATLLAALPVLAGCSLGQGTGDVKSDALFARECWGRAVDDTSAIGAPYDLQPDFFAAIPYRNTLQIRVQRGTDYTEVSDGIAVLIDDITKIREAIAAQSDAGAGDAGTTGTGGGDAGAAAKATFRVAIPAGVAPPGSPAVPPPDLVADPPIVHVSLYLQRSCHNQNTILYGVDGTMTFSALFDGDPNETSAAEKLTDAELDIQVGDLRDTPFGEYAGNVPPGLRSRLYGHFRFYFERGQPGQPFP